jgi:hypothetical protein
MVSRYDGDADVNHVSTSNQDESMSRQHFGSYSTQAGLKGIFAPPRAFSLVHALAYNARDAVTFAETRHA